MGLHGLQYFGFTIRLEGFKLGLQCDLFDFELKLERLVVCIDQVEFFLGVFTSPTRAIA